MIKALVFDFDGLILETEMPVYQSWEELFERHGLRLPFERWVEIIGTSEPGFDPAAMISEQIGNGDFLKRELEARLQRELELIEGLPAMPGVEAYLQDARRLGLKVALASSSSCKWVEGHLHKLGLREYFEAVLAKDDVLHTKPDPALFASAAEALGVAPQEAVAFEDSPNGVLSARGAGLFVVAVPNVITCRMDLSLADLTIGSFEEMPLEQLIEEVEAKLAAVES
jgi:HAD superfamily hydrolase (TIGR01509 family)